MGKWITEILDRVFAAASALCFAQLPLFMQQYQQQLAGAMTELNVQINHMKTAALQGGKTLPEYIQRFLDSGDADFVRQGHLIQAMYDRSISFAQASHALLQANPLQKPLLFFNYLNRDIASSTLNHFQPGIPLNLEGALYAIFGLCFGYALFFGLKRLFTPSPRQAPLPAHAKDLSGTAS